MLSAHVDERMFSLRAEGAELFELPNILLQAPPLISVRLHDLAKDTSGRWVLTATQKTYGRNSRQPVKVSITQHGGPRHMHLNFMIPMGSMCRGISEFIGWLVFHGGALMTVHVPLKVDRNRKVPTETTVVDGCISVQMADATDTISRAVLDVYTEDEVLALLNERRRQKLRVMETERPKRTARNHNQWASTEAHMNSLKERLDSDFHI